MISGIFGKTKPINYVLLLGLLFVLYCLVNFYKESSASESVALFSHALNLVLLLFSVLVIDFVVNRNQITSANSYVSLFFVLLVLLFASSISDSNAIGCNFFLILACRRLISLRSLKYMKLKILDATLWVLTSSLFYDWAVIFLLLVFIAIYIYEPKNLKNWLVPFVGLVSFFLVCNALFILANNEAFIFEHYEFKIGKPEELIKNWGVSSKLITFVVVSGITGMAVFLKSGKLGLGRIINLRVISLYLVLSILVLTFCLMDGNFPILICFFPAAVFLGKYVEMIKRKNLKELALSGCVLLSFLIFTLDILIK